MTDASTISQLAIAAVIAYFLGSVPTAYLAGKLYGKDIFNVGSRQAGATNVWREVSRTAGITVFLVDSAKGLTAILIARWLGVEGASLMLPSSAVILGHWNSPFTRFRGGDGVSSLTGVVLGINPIAALPAYLLVAFITLRFNSRLEHPTLWGAMFGYITYIVFTLTPIAPVEPSVVFGITGLGLAILLHSMVYHHRRMGVQEEPIQAPEDPTKRRLS
jgi:acyl-phosphate glycerol 3-phosphate acyltransferase